MMQENKIPELFLQFSLSFYQYITQKTDTDTSETSDTF